MTMFQVYLFVAFQGMVAYVVWYVGRRIRASPAVVSRRPAGPAPTHVKKDSLMVPDGAPPLVPDKADDDDGDGPGLKARSLGAWGEQTMRKWGSQESMEARRTMIINELFQTEESYLKSLHALRDRWIAPMTKAAADRSMGTLSTRDLQMLSFANVDIIVSLHDALLPQLKDASNIGAAFVKFGDYLKMYTAFVNGYDNVLSTLAALKANKKFKAFGDAIRAADPTLSLESLMIMPIQRIPRYLLLLTELKKHTPEFHTDYAAIATACERLKLIANHINSSKANFENVNAILQLQSRITGYDHTLIEPGRVLVHEGRLQVRKGAGAAGVLSPMRSTSQCMVVLFNDMCLWTNLSYKFKGSCPLSGARLELDNDDPDAVELALVSSAGTTCFIAESGSEREQWRARFQAQIDKLAE
ncbi:hypothetical protein PBRA_007297 [Plasmodiophora brassicae]|nr:hypothetical protein PBRA_007297 [Plasmodiophora brassicae]